MHPRLKAEDRTVIWYADLEATIKEAYNQDVNVLEMVFEPNNGSYYNFTVDGESEFDDVGDEQVYTEWLRTGNTKDLDLGEFAWEYDGHVQDTSSVDVKHLLHRLFKSGFIQAGKYTITCWW